MDNLYLNARYILNFWYLAEKVSDMLANWPTSVTKNVTVVQYACSVVVHITSVIGRE